MIEFSTIVLLASLSCAALPIEASRPQSVTPGAAFALPAGAALQLTLTRPVWAKTAKVGDPLYAQTNFPITAANEIAIPAGTYVEGRIDAITRPTRKVSRAEIDVTLTKIIFANGYTIVLPSGGSSSSNTPPTPTRIVAQATTANDLLLDNGAQFEAALAAPVSLDAEQVANAAPLTHAPLPGSFKSATLCRPTPGWPGSPGTPDTVIPGSPGTPSTTIPGGPGMPDITIPGTPATPSTIIPGTPSTPGSPGTVCPAPPVVISSSPIPPPGPPSVPPKSATSQVSTPSIPK